MSGTDGTSRQHIGVALSGGGHRAALFALGSLLYLVDAGKGPEIATVSSISGGSLTNGFVGLTTDLTTATPEEFRTTITPLAKALSTEGTIWSQPITYLYLGSMLAVAAAATVADFPLDVIPALGVWIVALVVIGWLSTKRSALANHTFDRKLYHGAKLAELNTTVDHVLCATDYQTAEHVYFSGRFVNSYRLGWGVPADLALSRAVQASAALPGAFNPVKLPIGRHRFQGTSDDAPKQMLLGDGGCYDNMGTEWHLEADRRSQRPFAPTPTIHVPDEIVVVNASAGLEVTERRSLRVPFLGEITTLVAVKDVLYDQTTAVRRRLLFLRFTAPADTPPAFKGAMVQIDRSPFAMIESFAGKCDEPEKDDDPSDPKGNRARDLKERLDCATKDSWEKIADESKGVKTALSKLSAPAAARLLHHAYVLTMVNTHILLDYPLLPIPDVADFERLLR
ncbi:MAG: patatin-like phospholipase family protein [Acidimicrobiia bacterium]